ncbi:MAG: hypothetical protein RSB41_01355 [Bacilli bacterium]
MEQNSKTEEISEETVLCNVLTIIVGALSLKDEDEISESYVVSFEKLLKQEYKRFTNNNLKVIYEEYKEIQDSIEYDKENKKYIIKNIELLCLSYIKLNQNICSDLKQALIESNIVFKNRLINPKETLLKRAHKICPSVSDSSLELRSAAYYLLSSEEKQLLSETLFNKDCLTCEQIFECEKSEVYNVLDNPSTNCPLWKNYEALIASKLDEEQDVQCLRLH